MPDFPTDAMTLLFTDIEASITRDAGYALPLNEAIAEALAVAESVTEA